jgi:hypothetical protein
MDAETKEIKHELLMMCWYMRGGLTYNEAFCLPPKDREIISQIIKDNLDTTKKTGQPFF